MAIYDAEQPGYNHFRENRRVPIQVEPIRDGADDGAQTANKIFYFLKLLLTPSH